MLPGEGRYVVGSATPQAYVGPLTVPTVGARWHSGLVRIPELLEALTEAGQGLAAAADSAGLDAKVPTCPEWTVRDLVFHAGGVHRWAATTVREKRDRPPSDVGGDPLADEVHRPADDLLLPWYLDSHATLLAALREASDDAQFWSFLPAPSPRAFWARRQAHEATMHRVDAELAGGAHTPVDPAVATDGIDELLTGFVVRRRGRLRTDQPRTLAVHATDTAQHWHLTISDEPVVAERSELEADVTVRGPASDVYLALWNRLSFGALDAYGDHELLSTWPELVRVRWS